MENIELSGKKYPIRFDFRALKEFKSITKNDVLKSFDAKDTDNIITLTWVAVKSGYFFSNPNATECSITEEEIARHISFGEMQKIISAFMTEIKGLLSPGSGDGDDPGEKSGTS
jgi:hypothetical protein